jgi:site-specific DNA-methyltransferase (cytosine-N4-specific)
MNLAAFGQRADPCLELLKLTGPAHLAFPTASWRSVVKLAQMLFTDSVTGDTDDTSRLRRPDARTGGYVLELPISKQFTPTQIDSLREFLRLVRDYGPQAGKPAADARLRVKDRFFSAERRGGTEAKRITQAGNAMSSARQWGLLGDDYALTDVGRSVLAAANDDKAAEIMVAHFLRHLGGAQTAKAILDLIGANDGIAPKKTVLAAQLHDVGIYENRDGTDHSAVLAWLAHPGAHVLTQIGRGRWLLDEQRFAELAGVTPEQVDIVSRRDPVQLALLVELARMPEGRSDSGAIQRLLSIRGDLKFQAPGFRRLYIDPLVRDGLIEISGRGRAGATVFSITELGRREAVADLISRFDTDGPLQYQPAQLLRPTNQIIADLDPANQPDRNLRGIALELLALRILSWIGLTGLRWRMRPNAAEEIDGAANVMMPSFSRWQVQAKNTARLDADDSAREIGLALTDGASVVMLITTGEFTRAARSVIDRSTRRSSLTIICVDGSDVREISRDPTKIRDILDREASRARSSREADDQDR